MIGGKMLFAVVERGKAPLLMERLRSSGAPGGTIINGRGTATSSILSMLGLGDSRREVLLSMFPSEKVDAAVESLVDVKAKGIVAILGEKGEKEMAEGGWTMIQVISERGYADDIMDAARKAGAKGGTVFKGHGTAKEDDIAFFGYPITAEKEVLVIIERDDKAKEIEEKIEALPFLRQKGKAVIFSLPVCSFRTIG